MPIFPDVPPFPGVPPLLRDASANIIAPIQQVLITANTIQDIFGTPDTPQWGLFKDGEPVVVADNVLVMEYRQDWSIADFPIEKGQFESYDKVNSPFQAKLRFSAGGSVEDRQALIDSIAAIGDTIDLYDIYTPEVQYNGVNVAHYDYRRESRNGVGLVIVEVWVQEIRETAESGFSNTKSASGADPVDQGTVQTQDATSQEIGLRGSVQ